MLTTSASDTEICNDLVKYLFDSKMITFSRLLQSADLAVGELCRDCPVPGDLLQGSQLAVHRNDHRAW